jgi:hypothetical protein
MGRGDPAPTGAPPPSGVDGRRSRQGTRVGVASDGAMDVEVDMPGVVAIEGVVSGMAPEGVVDEVVVLVVSVVVVSRFWHPPASATATNRNAMMERSLRIEAIGVPPEKNSETSDSLVAGGLVGAERTG